MQEEINHKTITVYIRGAKVTAHTLKAALRAMLRAREKHRQNVQRRDSQYAQDDDVAISRGKRTLRDLQDEGSELSNIEITDKNIRSFEKVARKYSIDYSLKKDKSVDPPKYLVFFRAKDVDVMTAAFKEYTGVTLKKSRKVSIRKRLQKAIQRSAKHREREKVKQKDRGQER